MKRIDFLVVGAQKSGTTALDYFLREHSAVSMASTKELHFFDDEANFVQKPYYSAYHANFPPFKENILYGEVTPIYMYWDQAIKRIWHYNRDIKLIIILRNPITRAYSHWNMEFKRNADTLSFSKAIRLEEQRSKEALPHKHRVYSYKDRGYYTEQLRDICRYFNKSQLLVLKHDDMKKDLNHTLKKVTDFLNIDTFQCKHPVEVHTKEYDSKLSFNDFSYLRVQFHYEIRSLEKMLSWNCEKWLKYPHTLKILFFRDFRGYSGGHQKVYDYFEHFSSFKSIEAYIYFSQNSISNTTNPWFRLKENTLSKYEPKKFDILFVAGMDWEELDDGIEEEVFVINFIQHVRHSYPENDRYKFLRRKALRICVSKEVEKALKETKIVNGPIYTIENSHKIDLHFDVEKNYDFFILGLKNRSLAKKLEDKLLQKGFKVTCNSSLEPREDIWRQMAASKISILLPNPIEAEGFYLPALEAMHYSDLTIVPDCIGNRTFCNDKHNCLMPQYNFEDIVKTTQEAMEIIADESKIIAYKYHAKETVSKHNIVVEREALKKIMQEIGIDV